LDRSENYDAFLKASGMGALKRGIVVKLKGSLEISREGSNRVQVVVVNGPKTKSRVIAFGEEFEEEGIEGRKIKGSWNIEGSKMVGNFVGEKGKKFKFIREIENGQLIQTMQADDVIARRFYNKK